METTAARNTSVLATDKRKSCASVEGHDDGRNQGVLWGIQKGASPDMRDFADLVPKIPQRPSWKTNSFTDSAVGLVLVEQSPHAVARPLSDGLG